VKMLEGRDLLMRLFLQSRGNVVAARALIINGFQKGGLRSNQSRGKYNTSPSSRVRQLQRLHSRGIIPSLFLDDEEGKAPSYMLGIAD
jgi:hypothetical protein